MSDELEFMEAKYQAMLKLAAFDRIRADMQRAKAEAFEVCLRQIAAGRGDPVAVAVKVLKDYPIWHRNEEMQGN